MNNKITSKVFLALLVIAFMLTNAYALQGQTPEKSDSHQTEMKLERDAQRRVEIPAEVLPATISENIISAYESAEIIKSWKWVNEQGSIEKYEVHLMKQGEDIRLEYDMEGNPMTLQKEKPLKREEKK